MMTDTIPDWLSTLTTDWTKVETITGVEPGVARRAALEALPEMAWVEMRLQTRNPRESVLYARQVFATSEPEPLRRNLRPGWFDDLTDAWRTVERFPNMVSAKARRAQCEKMADLAYEFSCKLVRGRKAPFEVVLQARVPGGYTQVVGLRGEYQGVAKKARKVRGKAAPKARTASYLKREETPNA